jgi:hypothetical protein
MSKRKDRSGLDAIIAADGVRPFAAPEGVTAIAVVDKAGMQKLEDDPNWKPVEAVLLTPAENLFQEGQEISSDLNTNLGRTKDRFYDRAIVHAQKVADQKPWCDPEFKEHDKGNPLDSLYSFLRASYTIDNSPTLAGQQAKLIAVAVDRGWTLEQLKGVNFKEGLEIARVVKEIPGAEADRLLLYAQDHNFNEVKAECYRAKHGVGIEPSETTVLTSSKSARGVLKEFDEATKKSGDNRPLGEKLADTIGEQMHATPNFDHRHAAVHLHSMNLAVWRYLQPDMKDIEDTILSVVFETPYYSALISECPPGLKDKWEQAKRAFDAALAKT